MNLILWRHAEAEDDAPDHTDAGRRLTAHGEKQAAKIAAWLNKNIAADASILASPARRTQQTVAALDRPFTTEARLDVYASVEDYLTVANEMIGGENSTVVLVGHQPTLGRVAAYLLSGEPQDWDVKRGSIWWLSQSGTHTRATLNCMLTPKLA